MKRPEHLGLRHVALFSQHFEASRRFYTELLGMHVEWEPDADNVYLSSGTDNLALHRSSQVALAAGQRLDHIGLIAATPDAVDEWHRFLSEAGVRVKSEPRSHRDGARSFYCEDPDGTTVQIIYHPPISDKF